MRGQQMRRKANRAWLLLLAVVFALLCLCLLLAADLWPDYPVVLALTRAGTSSSPATTASASPSKSPTSTTTRGASPTSTATPRGTSTLTLLSPANAQGPVGANLTLSGSSWDTTPRTQVNLSASATTCGPAGTALGQANAAADGTFTTTVVWPTALATTGATYALCASVDGHTFVTAPQKYRVRAASPPSLALSLSSLAVGQETQIEGSNFVGASSVKITLTTLAHGARTLATVVPDRKDGSFTLSYIPAATDLGSSTLNAASAPDGTAPPALQATLTVQIAAAMPTTTSAAPSPTAATNSTAPLSTASSSSPLAGVVLVAVALFLFVLLLIGMVAWLVLIPRPSRGAGANSDTSSQGPYAPGAGWGSHSGGYGSGADLDARRAPYPPFGSYDPTGNATSSSWGSSTSYPSISPYAERYPHDAPTLGPATGEAAHSLVDPMSGVPTRVPTDTTGQQLSHGPGQRVRNDETIERASDGATAQARATLTHRSPGSFGQPSLDDTTQDRAHRAAWPDGDEG